MKTLTISFAVDDDLTSERAQEYRWTVIRALQTIAPPADADYEPITEEQKALARKMLCDHER